MAKTTREIPSKSGPDNKVAVMEPPQNVNTEDTENNQDQEEPEPEKDPDTRFEETAGKEVIESRRGRGHHKEQSSGFFYRLSQFPKDEWEKLLLYIYRMAPITDRRASGEPVNYIAKLSEPIDEDYVLKEPNWGGSGKYRVRLNRTNADGRNTPVDVVEFTVENRKYPPQVPPGEWVEDPRNRRWAWAKPHYDGKVEAATPPAPPPQQAGTTIGELIEGVKSLKELTKEAAPPPPPAPPDPITQLKGTIEAVSAIVSLAKPPAPEKPPDDPMMKFVLDRLSSAEERNAKLMDRLLDKQQEPAPAPAAAPPDPLRDLAMKMLEKRLERMDETPGQESAEARASRMNGTQELISELTKAIAPVLDRALSFFTVIATAKAAAGPVRPQPRPQTVEVQPANPQQQQPAPEPAPGAPQEQPQETQQQQQPPQQPQMDPRKAMLNYILSQVTPTLMDHLENGDGDSFADWFCGMTLLIPNAPPPINKLPGSQAHAFAKQFGKDAILDAYKSSPELWQQIAPTQDAEAKFAAFIDAFLAYDPEAQDDTDED